MHETVDAFDPNVLFAPSDYQHRIYADDYENVYAVVDEADYQFFTRWRWRTVANSSGKKLYLKRTCQIMRREVYLHVAIHKRRGIEKPSPAHTIVDHIDCDSLHCRQENLRWATLSMNRRNRAGQHYFNI